MYKNIKLNKIIYTNIWSRTGKAKPVHTCHLSKEGKTPIEQSGTGPVRQEIFAIPIKNDILMFSCISIHPRKLTPQTKLSPVINKLHVHVKA